MDEQNVTQPNEEDGQNEAPEQEVDEQQPEETTDTQEEQVEEVEAGESEDESEPKTPAREEEEEESADYYADFVQQTQNTPQFDINSLVNQEDGTVDLTALQKWGENVAASSRQAAAQQYQQLREEDRQWEKVFEKYPQVKENKRLRDMVHKQRIGNVYAGGKNDLVQAAKAIFSEFDSAKIQGKQETQRSIKRQKSASLETSRTTEPADNSRERDLLTRVSSRNRQEADSARKDLLKEWLEQGKI